LFPLLCPLIDPPHESSSTVRLFSIVLQHSHFIRHIRYRFISLFRYRLQIGDCFIDSIDFRFTFSLNKLSIIIFTIHFIIYRLLLFIIIDYRLLLSIIEIASGNIFELERHFYGKNQIIIDLLTFLSGISTMNRSRENSPGRLS